MSIKSITTQLKELNRLIVLGAPRMVTTPKTVGVINQVIEEGKSFPLAIDFSDNNDIPHLKEAQGSWTAIITEVNVEFIKI